MSSTTVPVLIPLEIEKLVRRTLDPEQLKLMQDIFPDPELHARIFLKYVNNLRIPNNQDELSKIRRLYSFAASNIMETVETFTTRVVPDLIGNILNNHSVPYAHINIGLTDNNVKNIAKGINMNISGGPIQIFKWVDIISYHLVTLAKAGFAGNPKLFLDQLKELTGTPFYTMMQIYQEYLNNGYDWHYFGFFNKNDPRIVVRHDVELKPELFEVGQILIPQRLYPIIINKNEDTLTKDLINSLYPSEHKEVPTSFIPTQFQNLTPEQSALLTLADPNNINSLDKSSSGTLLSEYLLSLVEYNPDSNLNISMIDTSHDHYTGKSENLYRRAVGNLELAQMMNITTDRIGWTKKDINNAIFESGLLVAESQLPPGTKKIRKTPGMFTKYYFLDHGHYYPAYGVKDPKEIDRRFLSMGRRMTTTDYAVELWMPKIYYNALYRKIFGTLERVDWPLACQMGLVKPEILRNLAISDFYLSPETVSQLNDQQLCQMITDISAQRRRQRLEIARESAVRAPELIYQPGSIFVKPSATTVGGMMTTRPKFAPTEAVISQEIEDLCGNPSAVARERLLELAEQLGFEKGRISTLFTNNQICIMLRRQLALLRSARQP